MKHISFYIGVIFISFFACISSLFAYTEVDVLPTCNSDILDNEYLYNSRLYTCKSEVITSSDRPIEIGDNLSGRTLKLSFPCDGLNFKSNFNGNGYLVTLSSSNYSIMGSWSNSFVNEIKVGVYSSTTIFKPSSNICESSYTFPLVQHNGYIVTSLYEGISNDSSWSYNNYFSQYIKLAGDVETHYFYEDREYVYHSDTTDKDLFIFYTFDEISNFDIFSDFDFLSFSDFEKLSIVLLVNLFFCLFLFLVIYIIIKSINKMLSWLF